MEYFGDRNCQGPRLRPCIRIPPLARDPQLAVGLCRTLGTLRGASVPAAGLGQRGVGAQASSALRLASTPAAGGGGRTPQEDAQRTLYGHHQPLAELLQ